LRTPAARRSRKAHERDRRDAVALREVLLLVDVHLDDFHVVLVSDPIENRGDAWHGPHHSAQKSTITLPSDFRTSASNVSVVAVVAN